ncbi:hypothetical protein AYO49_05380 [Verrucomicrobiaceae bacterium SCGC AG-212-N21]|nr:hypothetical protein AYO49_05380 [Verrucomicrobiaceae bacterium SCGC AG-212-N21]
MLATFATLVLYVATWPVIEMNYVPVMRRVRQERIIDSTPIAIFYQPLHSVCRAHPEHNPLIAYWKAWAKRLGQLQPYSEFPWEPLRTRT